MIIYMILVFILSEIFKDSVRYRFLDVAILVVLMTRFVLALCFLFLTPFSKWIWLWWMTVLILCFAFPVSFDNCSLIHPW